MKWKQDECNFQVCKSQVFSVRSMYIVLTLKATQYHVLYHTTGQWTMSPKIDAASSNYELIQINFLFFSPKLCRKSWADVAIVAMLKN